jgi:hypothetical protein
MHTFNVQDLKIPKEDLGSGSATEHQGAPQSTMELETGMVFQWHSGAQTGFHDVGATGTIPILHPGSNPQDDPTSIQSMNTPTQCEAEVRAVL